MFGQQIQGGLRPQHAPQHVPFGQEALPSCSNCFSRSPGRPSTRASPQTFAAPDHSLPVRWPSSNACSSAGYGPRPSATWAATGWTLSSRPGWWQSWVRGHRCHLRAAHLIAVLGPSLRPFLPAGPNGCGKSNLLLALLFAFAAPFSSLGVSQLAELQNSDSTEVRCRLQGTSQCVCTDGAATFLPHAICDSTHPQASPTCLPAPPRRARCAKCTSSWPAAAPRSGTPWQLRWRPMARAPSN